MLRRAIAWSASPASAPPALRQRSSATVARLPPPRASRATAGCSGPRSARAARAISTTHGVGAASQDDDSRRLLDDQGLLSWRLAHLYGGIQVGAKVSWPADRRNLGPAAPQVVLECLAEGLRDIDGHQGIPVEKGLEATLVIAVDEGEHHRVDRFWRDAEPRHVVNEGLSVTPPCRRGPAAHPCPRPRRSPSPS
jgi:hypothetical protein